METRFCYPSGKRHEIHYPFTEMLTFISFQDIKLHYVEAGNNSGKPLMLMLHGFPEFWYSWRHQLEAFKHEYRSVNSFKRRAKISVSSYFRVVAIDMRGYGQSDKPSGVENYTISKLAEDVKNVVRCLGMHYLFELVNVNDANLLPFAQDINLAYWLHMIGVVLLHGTLPYYIQKLLIN